MYPRISKGVSRLSWLGEITAELALTVLLLLVFHEVIVRYAFDSPTLYTVEYSEYLLVFIAFLCTGWVAKQDGHVTVSFVVSTLPEKVQQILKLVTSLLTLTFCVILVWQGAKVVLTAFHGDYRSSSLLEFPLWIPYSAIPLGALIISLQYVVKIGDALKALKSNKSA